MKIWNFFLFLRKIDDVMKGNNSRQQDRSKNSDFYQVAERSIIFLKIPTLCHSKGLLLDVTLLVFLSCNAFMG